DNVFLMFSPKRSFLSSLVLWKPTHLSSSAQNAPRNCLSGKCTSARHWSAQAARRGSSSRIPICLHLTCLLSTSLHHHRSPEQRNFTRFGLIMQMRGHTHSGS